MNKKNKWDKLFDIFIRLPYGFAIGFVVGIIVMGKDLETCRQTLKEPEHCFDICADQLLRFENRGLITIHCQKCTTKGSDNE